MIRGFVVAASLVCVSGVGVPRRGFLAGSASVSVVGSVSAEEVGTGRTGLLLLPPVAPLRNNYIFVSAGESVQDALGVVVTNPAWKLSVQNSDVLTFLN